MGDSLFLTGADIAALAFFLAIWVVHGLAADGRLIILDEDGTLGLGIPSPDRFQAVAKWPMLTSVAWTPPTLAGHRLYLRDRRVIMALDLSALR